MFLCDAPLDHNTEEHVNIGGEFKIIVFVILPAIIPLPQVTNIKCKKMCWTTKIGHTYFLAHALK